MWYRTILPFALLFVMGLAWPSSYSDAQNPKKQKEAAYQGKTVGQWVNILKSSKSTGERKKAAEALGKISPVTKEVVPVLIGALKDKEYIVRGKAALALGRIGPAAKEAAPVLIRALERGEDTFLVEAAYALGNIGPVTKDVVPALIKRLKDSDPGIRITTALALGRIGPAAKKAVPILKVVSENDPVSRCRSAAAKALKRIQLPENSWK